MLGIAKRYDISRTCVTQTMDLLKLLAEVGDMLLWLPAEERRVFSERGLAPSLHPGGVASTAQRITGHSSAPAPTAPLPRHPTTPPASIDRVGRRSSELRCVTGEFSEPFAE